MRRHLQPLGDRLRRKADLFSADLAERDATIERVKAQLNEATNVPDRERRVASRRVVEGAAGPCQSCGQPASTHYHLILGGCMNSEINAADDRRAL